MRNVVYLKEPGYIQDLYFAFILYYNKTVITEKFVLKDKAAADTKFYKEAIQRFEPFDDDLLPFFHLKDDSFCFMSVEYFRDMDYLDEFFFNTVLKKLDDKKSVVIKMMSLYLGIYEEFEQYHMQDIGRLIKGLPYSDAVKYSLALFFMNPEYYIDKLVADLKQKEKILKQYYIEHADYIFKTQAEVDIDDLIRELNQSSSKRTLPDSQTYYSINLINKYHISYMDKNNGLFFLLGTDFKGQLESWINFKEPPNMILWGKVYSERNRITILKMLKKNGELCTSDIAERINLSPTSVYYHLEMMFDARMLNSRNEGRTIYYSINKEYFRRASNELGNFAEE